MYKIVIKYYSYEDRQCHSDEINSYSLIQAIEDFREDKDYATVVLEAKYFNEQGMIDILKME